MEALIEPPDGFLDPSPRPGFNYEFLIFMIISTVIAIFFLLYFNRLFGSVISYGIRTWTWHRYRIYIDIQALQVSLLAGRVFFTGLRYHGSNETFHIQHGDITWRYWLRRVRDADILASSAKEEDPVSVKERNSILPCRINVNIVGLEWFVYNRSPAYGSVLTALTNLDPSGTSSSGVSDEKSEANLRTRNNKEEGERPKYVPITLNGANRVLTDNSKFEMGNRSPSRSTSSDGNDEPELPSLLRLLPISVECQKAAAVFGNDNTKAILIVKADSLSGIIDALETKTVDQYQQVFKINFEHPLVEMKENLDFKEDQATRATRERGSALQKTDPISRKSYFRQQRRKALSSLRNMVPYWRRSVESFSSDIRPGGGIASSHIPDNNQWQGLSRYLDDQDMDDKARWSTIEYAAVSTVLDSPAAQLTVYWDVVSTVTEEAHRQRELDSSVNINGSEPPAWGISLTVKGGTMNYGPWADRQRVDLQRVFVPSISKNGIVARPLPIGASRIPTQFKLSVEVEDTVTLRIPIREESKNWRWRGKEPQMKHEDPRSRRKRNRTKKSIQGETTQLRPSGWFEFKIPRDATVSYVMDMIASPTGFKTDLTVDLPSTELWSSVNHDVLWRSGAQRIYCDLSTPLSWNALRNWNFSISSDYMEMYLLRDHVFLIVDLVDDWATGPPSEYLVFTPFLYHLQLCLKNVKVYLNVNDENIIDKATAMEDNSYLVLSSPELKAETTIPLDEYRPAKNSIPFNVRADTLDLSLHTSQSNTLASFLASKELAHVDGLTTSGSYQYNATTSPANTDTLVLNLHAQSPYAYLYGFVVRYVMMLKDNYFGEHVHFKTLDEYQEQLQAKAQTTDAEISVRHPKKKSNDLDVVLAIKVDDPRVLLPTNIYSAKRYIQCELASLSLDLRFTNYYMDMELELSPISLSLGTEEIDLDSPSASSSNTQLFIDGVRVFGHRTFGLPPTEPTYLCNWDVAVGAITGECTVDFVAALAKGGPAFGFTFDDVENAMVPYSSLIFYDITFVRLAVQSVRLWIHVEESVFFLSTDTIDINSNDWAGSHYSKRANIHIPNINFACVNAESAARHRSRNQQPVDTEAFLKTDIRLASIGRKFHFSDERNIQQDLVRREDQRTDRTPFLLRDAGDDFIPEPFDPPAQCIPPPPLPIADSELDKNASQSTLSIRSRKLTRQKSFLSLSSSTSSSKSVRKPQSQRQMNRRSNRADILSINHSFNGGSGIARDRGEISASTGGQTSFHSLAGDFSAKENTDHSPIAFSSQYFIPHFPLDGVRPDSKDAMFEDIQQDEYEFFNSTDMNLNDIDAKGLSEKHAQTSLIIEFPSGINAFVTPEAVRHATSLLTALQASEPEDILDSLQTESLTDIFKSRKEAHILGEMDDILVKLPRLNFRFLSSSTLDSPDPSQEEHDQYDLVVSKVSLVTRTTKDKGSGLDRPISRTSLQLRLGSAEISASERLSAVEQPQAAVMFQIDDVRASLGAKEVTYFDADIGSIVGSTASGKVEYLASLIHRTGNVASELGHVLREAGDLHSNCVRNLLLRLLEAGEVTNDPSFLIRPSAVLRSSNKHLRTCDSWKLAMRLRQIWTTMNELERAQLIRESYGQSLNLPPSDAWQIVVAAFEKWRSWDLDDASSALLLERAFGKTSSPNKGVEETYPLLGAFRLGEIRFVLDPGPKQNKIGLVDLTARLDKKTTSPTAGSHDIGPVKVLNVFCRDASVNLNWELCVLADDILRLYSRNQGQTLSIPKIDPPLKKTDPGPPSAYHVAIELIRGSIELETVNLKATTLGDGLKASLLLYDGEEDKKLTSLMMNCNAVTSTLHSHSHHLGVSQFLVPSLFISHELLDTDGRSTQTVKATASSKVLTLVVKQDPIGLMEVVDLLFRDEVTQLYRLKSQLPDPPKLSTTVKKAADPSPGFKINIAMFLDEYKIRVPLVQSLTYQISGVVARAACAANSGREIIFDFDIKENSHEMQVNGKSEPLTISLLQIPPTNGRITSQMHGTEHLLNVLCSVEVMQLDASAIYNLLTALNRPQISTAIEEVQGQMKTIQEHISDIFGNDETEKVEKNASNLVYTVHMTLAGLQVAATTSLKSRSGPVGQVLFSLERAHLRASNRHEAHGPILAYPEVHINLRHIGLDILRGQEDMMKSCGSLGASVTVSASSSRDENGKDEWSFNFRSDDFDVNLSPETISTVVDVLGYLGTKIKDLDTSRELDYLRKLRHSKPRISLNDDDVIPEYTDIFESVLGTVMYRFELRNIRASWNVVDETGHHTRNEEDLVLSVHSIEFGTRTKRSARLVIQDFQLQTVPPGQDKSLRSSHSALLPQVVFNIAYFSTKDARRMAFQAFGASLDLRLTPGFIVPAANLVQSIGLSAKNVQKASAQWGIETAASKKPDPKSEAQPDAKPEPAPTTSKPRNILGNKRLEILLIDADFAGAVVYISSHRNTNDIGRTPQNDRASLAGKYGQFSANDSGSGATLRSPGLAWKAKYRDNGREDPALYGEIKIDASSNILYPSVVPLIIDIISSVKEVVSNDSQGVSPANPLPQPTLKSEKTADEDNILTADPSAVLGRMKLNLGLRICRQEFSLSCQPIARVAATTSFDSVYFTLNTISSQDQGNFFAISGVMNKPQASVQHVYSRESTGSFGLETVTISLMNSKHVSGTSGVSAILKVSPMEISINAKQVQDFLLFREIWYPKDLRGSDTVPVAKMENETSQGHLVGRYQQVAATAAFPWTATISIAALDVSVDMGQAIGRSMFQINNFWVSSKKTSDWEQNLCLGFDKIGIDCTGRLSGFIALQRFKLRTSIQWPKREEALNETPLVLASISFNELRIKAAFDYQAFLIADITALEFLMYNVRESREGSGDRLVAIFNGDAVQVFGTSTSAAQGVALYQAITKLMQERKENFESSLKEIEKFMRRKSTAPRAAASASRRVPKLPEDDTLAKSPISLDTDVVVTLRALNLGVFPGTFSDHQVFKVEALNAYARFAASIERRRIHSILKMTLGQLRIGLSGVRNIEAPKTLNEMSVEDVVQRSTGARGGAILKVPRVEATMQTWQAPNSNHIDYLFKSAFEGKVEVGWNYSRVSYIRGMWAKHNKALEEIWGRQLPLIAVKITGVPGEEQQKEGEQQKITAEVNVPQSKYNYTALEPPVIETPQLRDMGEATPPLEWIGLHRDRLPNLTHQIVIVALLELAGEVEDAYSKILGSS